MPVLHHKVHILEITEEEAGIHLMHSSGAQKSVIMKLDENHWLIDSSKISEFKKVCEKSGISIKNG